MTAMDLSARVARVREKMAAAALKAGRDPEGILLCAACKAQASETVLESASLPIDLFGENRAQEMAAHLQDGAYMGKPVHFIGHLQTNKVRQVVGKAALIQSVDRPRLLGAIAEEAGRQGIVQDVLIEVNLGNEESKAGVSEADLPFLLELAAETPGVRLRGLMAIPPLAATEEEVRGYFARLRELRDGILAQNDSRLMMDILSMGMSGSFEAAILEGATLVRVGRDIYGERN